MRADRAGTVDEPGESDERRERSERFEGESARHPVWLGLLGGFHLSRHGELVAIRSGGKTEALLVHLGQATAPGVPRAVLLDLLWPDSDTNLASNALNNLVYNLRGMLSEALGGASPILCSGGYYRLNHPVGVLVDVERFKAHATRAEQHARLGQMPLAAAFAERAVGLYRGDLSLPAERGPHALLQRDRLRATCLSMLMLLADDAYRRADLAACLTAALRLLTYDPCREDAHRLVMRCHVRRGERAQALRHYRTVQSILRLEFDADPEPATTWLYEQIRSNPATIASADEANLIQT